MIDPCSQLPVLAPLSMSARRRVFAYLESAPQRVVRNYIVHGQLSVDAFTAFAKRNLFRSFLAPLDSRFLVFAAMRAHDAGRAFVMHFCPMPANVRLPWWPAAMSQVLQWSFPGTQIVMMKDSEPLA